MVRCGSRSANDLRCLIMRIRSHTAAEEAAHVETSSSS